MGESEQAKELVNTEEKEGPSGSNSRTRLDSTTRGQEIRAEAKALITKCYCNLAEVGHNLITMEFAK